MSDLKSKRETTIKKWALKELNNALSYYQSLGWCKKTGDYLVDMSDLIGSMKQVESNKIIVLDGFMKNPSLYSFLMTHSVFKLDAYTDGEFIENYMIHRLRITEEGAMAPFRQTIPPDILRKFAAFEPEIVPLEIYPYRIEYGCRRDFMTNKYNKDPITIIDLDFDLEKVDAFKPSEFISQFDDMVL